MTNLMRLFLQISVTASAMILVVMAMRALLSKRMNPVVVMVLWAVVLVRLCIPVMLESPVNIGSIIPEQPLPQVSEETNNAAVLPELPTIPTLQDTTSVPEPFVPVEIQQPERYGTTQGQPSATAYQSLSGFVDSVPWWSILTAVWIVGAAIVLGVTARHYIMFKRRLRKCVQTTDGTIIRIINQYKQELGVNKKVTVIECSDIKTPAVFGYYNPVILLPAGFTENMDDYAVRCILLHEMCHIKRCDVLKSYAWLAAKALHWFNPLVWIAYKMFKDDTELCCDQMVLSKLSDKRKYEYTQSLIDVFRMSKQAEVLSLTISLFENKTKLVERVMRMLKPERKSKAAVGVSLMLVAVMIVACFTTACMPVDNVGEPITVNDESEDQKFSAVDEHKTDNQKASEKKVQVYDAPTHWANKFTATDSIIEINADADVVVPNVDAVPTWEVEANVPFTQEMVDKMIQVFFGDAPLYKPYTTYGTQLQLDIAMDDYDRMQKGTFKFPSSCDEISKQEIMEDTKQYIKRVKSELENPPENPNPVTVKPELTKDENGIWSLNCVVDLGQDEIASFSVGNVSTNASMSFVNGAYYTMLYNESFEALAAPVGDLSISKADAKNQADDILYTLGIKGFALTSSYISGKMQPYISNLDNGKNYAHTFIYTKNLDGIPVWPYLGDGFPPYNKEELELLNYPPEFITITINDDGLRQFSWRNRFEIGDIAEPNTTLLPFENIKTRVEEEMCNTYNGMGDILDGQGWDVERYLISIDTISLGYARLPVNGDYNNQQLIPVWNVYATEEWHYVKTGALTRADGKSPVSHVVLTINAINGDVI